MPISIMPICPKLPLESGPALGTLSICLKMGITPPTSVTVRLKEGPVLKEPAIMKLTLGLTQEMSSSQLFAGKIQRYTATSATPTAWRSRSISVVRRVLRMPAHRQGAGRTTATTTDTQAATGTLSGLEATITPKASWKMTTHPFAMTLGDLQGDAYYLPPQHPAGDPPSTSSVCAGRAARKRPRRPPPSPTAQPCPCT